MSEVFGPDYWAEVEREQEAQRKTTMTAWGFPAFHPAMAALDVDTEQ